MIADTRWRRLSWLRALPLLSRHITRTMPWGTLITSCLAVLAVFTLLVRVAHHDQATFWLDQGTIRLSLLPVAAALAFVPSVPFRPLTRATPVPAWVTPAAHLLLAVPILALTFWAQLRIMAPVILAHAPQPPGVSPGLASESMARHSPPAPRGPETPAATPG